jgi:CheY-like chemotaxis protein
MPVVSLTIPLHLNSSKLAVTVQRDAHLPGMDGYEAVTHLKRDAVTQTIPIVAISAHAANIQEERKRLIALGTVSFLPKPFSIAELLDEVEVALKLVTGPTAS